MAIFSLSIQAQDKKEEKKLFNFKPTFKVNGRIQYDYEFLKRVDADNGLNENEFRRIHFSVDGNVSKRIKYKVEVDFAHANLGFRDVYIKYTSKKMGNLTLGSYAEPTGLDMATSSKYSTFNERALLIAMQNFRWGSGIHYENYNLLQNRATLQMALTNNGKTTDGFVDTSLEDGMNFMIRATGTAFNDKEKHKIVHLGANFAKRPYADLKIRLENHMGDRHIYEFPNADTRTELGFELASTFGPLSIQGEYKTQSYDAENVDYTMSGYYAFASYFLTGEHRPYTHGAFGRVKPKSDIDNNGYGAIEIMARYSNINASDDVITVNTGLPKNINNITMGLSWYLNAHAKMMYNYVITDDDNTSLGNLNQHLIRVQLDF